MHALQTDGTRVAADHDDRVRGLLVVEMSEAPGALPLPGARLEAELLAELAPHPTVLSGARATREAVLRALPAHAIAHFACHAVRPRPRPSTGFCRTTTPRPRSQPWNRPRCTSRTGPWPTLSACETAKSDERLADEAIHLATAFQLAGHRHVVGTLWPVADSAAGRVAADFCTGLAPAFDADDTARTLHRAVHALREDAPGRPSRWAGHVHFGGQVAPKIRTVERVDHPIVSSPEPAPGVRRCSNRRRMTGAARTGCGWGIT